MLLLLLLSHSGFEARGLIFGAPLALALGCAFVPLRKPGKLPGELQYSLGRQLIHSQYEQLYRTRWQRRTATHIVGSNVLCCQLVYTAAWNDCSAGCSSSGR